MKYMELNAGNETISFSKIAIGSAMKLDRIGKEDIFKIFDTYFELGGNCIDSARSYNGASCIIKNVDVEN